MAERGLRKTLTGKVVSDKMDKTIVVEVSDKVKDATYRKYVSRRTRYKAHDERNECGIGDVVTIQESRPLSKQKRWRLLEVKTRAVR
ncbi:MAG: 30S ribosomal protein S17 [Myxococcota bacterium]|nr:30S ribosomal protein S17 [Myxococcota bacterium]